MLNKLIREQKTFLITFSVWIIASIFVLLFENKLYWQLWINNQHTIFTDYFFYYFTFFGDGFLIVIASIFLLFYRIRFGLFSLISYLLSGLFVQVFKRFVFYDVNRPGYVFEQLGIDLHEVLELSLKNYHSFPSGHTTSAFALFFSLSTLLAINKKGVQIIFLTAAILVAISRVYLNQHFFNDVIMGSIIGIVSVKLVYLIFEKINNHWIEKSLPQLLTTQKTKKNNE